MCEHIDGLGRPEKGIRPMAATNGQSGRRTVFHYLTTMPVGAEPTGIIATTKLEAVSITDTVPSNSLVTYARVPAELMAMLFGTLPTDIALGLTRLATRSITETVP